MKIFENINKAVIAGIMTGNSLDGIDVAIVRFSRDNEKFHYNLLAFDTFEYEDSFKIKLKAIIEKKASIDIISEVNIELSHLYADALIKLCSNESISLDTIYAVGIHGQTVWHDPHSCIPNTLQLGSISALSKIINKIVVGDFRIADLVLGGEGAPLVPIFDYNFLKSHEENRIILNIGGIANVTNIPQGSSIEEVIAFDTGPGNTLIDCFTKEYFDMDYDKNGDIASFGEIIQPLFDKLKEDTFIKKVPPKSTGKEKYNKEYIMNLINELNLNKLKPDNIIRTLTEFTVWSIAENIRLFCSNSAKIIASGGGIHNNFLWKRLRNVLNQYELIKSNAYGLNPDAKEAICFAFLAFSTLNKIPTNLPNVTGAKKKTVLGVISIPD